MKAAIATPLTPDLLSDIPLPQPQPSADKDSRGTVLVAGGSATSAGAVSLTAEAAFRSGAGKVLLAVPQPLARAMALGFPEAGVHGFASTRRGDPAPAASGQIASLLPGVDAAVIGPGLSNELAAQQLAIDLLDSIVGTALVVDAMSLTGLWNHPSAVGAHAGRLVITPHAGEMARLTGASRQEVAAQPLRFAQDAAHHLHCVVVLKGDRTVIAQPEGTLFLHAQANPGLATAGSGDVLAGIVGALMARGLSALNAALWGVYLHAQAGRVLCERIGPLGFLARELSAEIPLLMRSIPPGSTGSAASGQTPHRPSRQAPT